MGRGLSISLSPCCFPATQVRKGECFFACCKSLLNVERAGASPRGTFHPGTVCSPQKWVCLGLCICGVAMQAGDPHWLSPGQYRHS